VPPILTVPASTFNANPVPPVVTVGAPAIVNVFAVPEKVDAVVTGAAKYVNEYVDAPVSAVPDDTVVDPAPLNVVVAFKIDAAPKYAPPETLNAPVELFVEAVVFANVIAEDAPDNAKMADVPFNVTLPANNEFAPAYRPPATCKAPVELLVEAVVLAKVNVEDAPDNARTADVPERVKLPDAMVCVPVELVNNIFEFAPASGNV
jgi:hypothetical protein